ncbi:MAG: PadR family transcriptional regulator [Solirubrobacteraceae bacterium]|nr:PadR family transcriptional regulator [Solirubrobacteraceae bacterium]
MAARPLNATAASLLGFLHDGPRTGWELVATAEMVIGPFWSLTRSQVYRELASMAESGFVVAGDPGPRDRRPYEITDAGREEFAAWASQEPGEEAIRFPLLLLISLGRHIEPGGLAPAVHHHRRLHAERLARLEQSVAAAEVGADSDPFALATMRFGLGYERTVVAWFDDLPPEIRGEEAFPPVPEPAGVGGRGDGNVA